MKSSLVSRRAGACVAVAGAVVVCVAPAALWAQRYSRPIEFSAPLNRAVSTNLNEAKLKGPEDRTPWLQLEDTPFRASDLFSSGDSLQGVMAPVYRPAPLSPAQKKRLKEKQDRRKNWEFADPDEAASVPTPEEMLNLPEYDANGQEKKPANTLDRYYERLDSSRKQTQDRPGDEDRFRARKEPNLIEKRLRQTDNPLRNGLSDLLTGANGGDPTTALPGADNSPWSLEQARSQKAHLSEFRQLLDLGPSPATASGLASGFTPSVAPARIDTTFSPLAAPSFGLPSGSAFSGPASIQAPTVNAQPFSQPAPPPASLQPLAPVPVRRF